MSSLALLTLFIVLIASCAYYNTFYHARKYFNEAEQKRQEQLAKDVKSKPPDDRMTGPSARPRSRSTPSAPSTSLELYDKAIEKAARVVTFYPNSRWVDDSLLLMGKAFYWKGDYPKAARKFEELSVHFPHSKHAQEAPYWRALALLGMGRKGEAGKLLEALTRAPQSSFADNALLALAQIGFDEDDYQRAASLCRTSLDTFNKSDVRSETWLLLGKALFALEQFAPAAEAFSRAVTRKTPPSVEYEARLMQARCLKGQGKYVEALRFFRRLAQQGAFGEHAADLQLEMADCFTQLGDVDAALDHYQDAAENFPKSVHSAEAYYRMGYLYETTVMDRAQARSSYQKASEESPAAEAAKNAKVRAENLGLQEDYLDRLRPFLRSARVNGVEGTVGTEPVGASLQQDTTKAGVDTLRSAASADSLAAASLLVGLAELHLFRLEQPDSALKYYQHVVDTFPADTLAAKAHYAIGWIQAEALGDSAAARSTFGQVAQRYPNTKYAQAAARRLEALGGCQVGVSTPDSVSQKFLTLEALRLGGAEPGEYLPGLERLARDHPQSPYAPRAAYAVAWTYERILRDSVKAHKAYQRLAEGFLLTEQGAVARAKLGLSDQKDQQEPSALPDSLVGELVLPAVGDSAVGGTAGAP